MNWVDIMVLVVWGITAFWGFRSGLLQMVIPALMVIIGLALSSRIAGPVGNIFSPFTDSENLQSVAAFIAIFLVLLIGSAWVSFALRNVLRIVPLFGLANSLAGLAVGVLVGFVLLSGILTGIQRFPVGNLGEAIDESPLGAFLADNFDVVIRGAKLIPGDWNDKFQGLKDDLKENIGEKVPVPGQ